MKLIVQTSPFGPDGTRACFCGSAILPIHLLTARGRDYSQSESVLTTTHSPRSADNHGASSGGSLSRR